MLQALCVLHVCFLQFSDWKLVQFWSIWLILAVLGLNFHCFFNWNCLIETHLWYGGTWFNGIMLIFCKFIAWESVILRISFQRLPCGFCDALFYLFFFFFFLSLPYLVFGFCLFETNCLFIKACFVWRLKIEKWSISVRLARFGQFWVRIITVLYQNSSGWNARLVWRCIAVFS